LPSSAVPAVPADQAPPPASAVGAAWRRWAWLLPPVAVGAFLRLFRLSSQILLGDELHGPRAAQRHDLATVLTTYLPSDHSMPLTALYELLMESGVDLTELHLRLPVLLAALLSLVVVPVALERRLGRAAGVWSAWLVALSPGLVLYGRIARSYVPMVLLAFVAAMAFERWWRTRRPGAAVSYAVSGAAAAWFHLGAAPFVAAPLLWGGLAALRRPPRLRRLGAVALAGAGLAAGFAAFLLPAWESFAGMLGEKSGHGLPSWRGAGEVALAFTGVAEPWAGLGFWALAAAGLAVLARRRPAFASYSLLLVAVHLAATLVMRPFALAATVVFHRYVLVTLPLVLAWVAVALAAGGEALVRLAAARGRPLRAAAAAAPAAVLALLILAGPYSDPRVLYSSFLHDTDFVQLAAPLPAMQGRRTVSAFYHELAAAPDEQPVIELTALPTWMWESQVRAYQDVHRQRVYLSPQEPALFAGGLDLANHVEPRPEAFLATPARWLVVHRRSVWELDRIGTESWTGLRVPPPLRPLSRRVARRLGGWLERRWGPPDHADARILVWDLERVRDEREPPRPAR
jgi:hypothetical protein